MTTNRTLETPRRELTFAAAQFSCPAACRRGAGFHDSIEYSQQASDAVSEKYVFWGPYIELDPGVYLFTFRGELEGELTFDFACEQGRVSLKTVTLNNFAQPICLVLTEGVKDLELRGIKGAGLKSLRIAALSVTCAYQVEQSAAQA